MVFYLRLRAIFWKALHAASSSEIPEDLIEVRDFENFLDLGRQADYFHLPTLFDYGNVNASELADSRAIQILQIGQVQDNVLVTLLSRVLRWSREALRIRKKSTGPTSTSETRPDWRIWMEKSAWSRFRPYLAAETSLPVEPERDEQYSKEAEDCEKNVGPVTASAERQFAIGASLRGGRSASFPRGPRERFPDRARDISGARRWWGEIATRARPYKRAEDLLQRDAWKIAVTSNFSALQLAPDAQPIVGGLQGQVNVLAGFQFDDGEPSRARDGEEIEKSHARRQRWQNLSIDESRIESGIHAGDILANEGFQPAFAWRAVQGMAGIAGRAGDDALRVREEDALGRGERSRKVLRGHRRC